jgi:hypothetical protein
MRIRHVSRRIVAYLDGELGPRTTERTARHLERCARCREDAQDVRFAMTSLEQLPLVEAPEAIWRSIEAARRERRPPEPSVSLPWRLLLPAAAAILLVVTASWFLTRHPETGWTLELVGESPAARAAPYRETRRIKAGDRIETDSLTRATINVGGIGSVEVAPNTRIRVVTARPDDHRLALDRGVIQAKISAPPRLFFVETVSGTAVDLGCEYTLSFDDDGGGLLHVTKGWVAFEWRGLESLVPAHAFCETRPRMGPGIPYFDDASQDLKQAIATLGQEKVIDDAVSVILSGSRVRDTLTLWHLLSRVDENDRARVFDRIAELTPVPAGVTREQVLRLDPETLKRLREELAWTW